MDKKKLDRMIQSLKEMGCSKEELDIALSIAQATYQDKGDGNAIRYIQQKREEIRG